MVTASHNGMKMEQGRAIGSLSLCIWFAAMVTLLFCCKEPDPPAELYAKPLEYVRFNGDGTHLITKSASEYAPDFWNPSTGVPLAPPNLPLGKCIPTKANDCPDLFICGEGVRRELFDVRENRPIGEYHLTKESLERAVMVSPDRRFLIEWRFKNYHSGTGPNNFVLKLHSLSSGTTVKVFYVTQNAILPQKDPVLAPVAFSDDGQLLAITSGEHGTYYTRIYAVDGLSCVHRFESNCYAQELKFSPGKRYLAEYTPNRGWFILRSLDFGANRDITPPRLTSAIIFMNDDSAVCITNNNSFPREAYLLNCITGEAELLADSLPNGQVAVDRGTLAWFDHDYTLHLMKISTKKTIWSAKSFPARKDLYKPSCCTFSPDGRYLATWNTPCRSWNPPAYADLWDVKKRRLIRHLTK